MFNIILLNTSCIIKQELQDIFNQPETSKGGYG